MPSSVSFSNPNGRSGFIGSSISVRSHPELWEAIARVADRHGMHHVGADHIAELVPSPFETRRVYRLRTSDGETIIASRFDALVPFLTSVEPDLSTIASNWRFVNGFSTTSIIVGIDRLPPTNHEHGSQQDPDEAMLSVLRQLGGSPVVLALSGGIDSRTMMALLHGAGVPFQAVTYGLPSMPDWITAQRVSASDGIEWSGIDVRSIDAEDLWQTMSETAFISEGTYNVAHAAVLPTLARRFPNATIVDGAYGGVLRGGLANRMLVRGQADLESGDAARIERWLEVETLDVFHPDIREEMRHRSQTLLQQALDGMPTFKRAEGREWVDEFFLRWYVPGYVSNPQRVYDPWMRNDMPFLDPAVVSAVLAASPTLRAKAALFKKWVRKYRPGIASVPCVGKRGMVPWACSGNPFLTAIAGNVLPKHRTPDAGQMEIGIISKISSQLADAADEYSRHSLIPFYLPKIQELTAETLVRGHASSAQAFFSWLSLALALRPVSN